MIREKARNHRQQQHKENINASSRGHPEPKRPWGLGTEDVKTIDSLTDPNTVLQGRRRESLVVSTPAHVDQSEREEGVQDSRRLTHVNSSGEARMVDVGAKFATRRVAIATNYVTFSNEQPFRLISDNSNKKGDVLGVARVAGIMAAKRTSDLIPLCHPVAISKVEVDLKLGSPRGGDKSHGVVLVTALVECTGPTGVEMEALTAATGAALTVYDMCKAVDRGISINFSRVVYKSGGKSGLHHSDMWVSKMGQEYFLERNLEVRALLREKKSE